MPCHRTVLSSAPAAVTRPPLILPAYLQLGQFRQPVVRPDHWNDTLPEQFHWEQRLAGPVNANGPELHLRLEPELNPEGGDGVANGSPSIGGGNRTHGR
jgi:hypothetical protein